MDYTPQKILSETSPALQVNYIKILLPCTENGPYSTRKCGDWQVGTAQCPLEGFPGLTSFRRLSSIPNTLPNSALLVPSSIY